MENDKWGRCENEKSNKYRYYRLCIEFQFSPPPVITILFVNPTRSPSVLTVKVTSRVPIFCSRLIFQAISVGIHRLMEKGDVLPALIFSEVEFLAMLCPSLLRTANSKKRLTAKDASFVRLPSRLTKRSPVDSSTLNVKLKVSADMAAKETVTRVCKLNPIKSKENS